MIKSIDLKNWKVHSDTHLDFDKGVNILIGIMGAGKSSIVDAISFGLFGTFPALNSGRVKLDNLISNSANVNEASVKLEFDIDNNSYTVTRKIKREKGADALLEKNGKFLQTQPKRVNEEIESLLKLNYDTFIKAIYAEQNKLDYFLDIRKGERKKSIDEMLGLDRFTNVDENATSVIGMINRIIKEDEQLIGNIDVRSIKQQIEDLSVKKQDILGEIGSYKSEFGKLSLEVEKYANSLKEMKEKRLKKLKLKEEMASISSKINTLKAEMEKISVPMQKEELENNYLIAKNKFESLSADLEKSRKQQMDLARDIATAKSDFEANSKKLKENEEILLKVKEFEKLDLDKAIAEAEDRINKENLEIASDEGSVKELSKWVAELSKDISKCPVCDREIGTDLRLKLLEEKNSSIADYKSKILLHKNELNALKEKFNAFNEDKRKLDILRGKLEDIDKIKQIIDLLSSKSQNLKSQYELVAKTVEGYNSNREQAREDVNKIEKYIEDLKRQETLKKSIDTENKALKEKNGEFQSIDISEDRIENLQNEYNNLYSKRNEIKIRYETGKKRYDDILLQIADKINQVNRVEESEERVSSRKRLVSSLEKFRTALKETESGLRNRLVSSVNDVMADLWPKIYPYGDYEYIMLNTYKDDYLLEGIVNINGKKEKVSIDSFASGGERSTASLALRIALGMVIVPNLKWIILDEPTHNLDAAGISRLVSVFSETLPDIVEQIFIITHDDSLKQVHPAKIYMVERDKEARAPAAISEL
ncbi:chromosome segregation ATPase [Candidatus Mancarchaeum acidiphilum]|uniref:Chromosome segregation ATPase n=1 Tax=Candidatus Mancarchaeum acidiphilum TaxID=1920749 RepID=A0A218NNP9_9ARCH|nr:ATP-binding protein [Candidatus Mancarchaeum acidiphilum]ASI14082.1 chromosome segregation ATPase [Candidatus Mancarchaeum acidiphilum]